MLTRVIVNAISFASSIILARLLVPEDFGIVAMALAVSAIITALTSLPISEALIRTDDIGGDHFDSAFTLGLIRATLLALLLAAAAWPITSVYNDPQLGPIMFLLAGHAFIGGFFSPKWAMIQKRLSFGPDAVLWITSRIIGTIASLLIAFYFRTYWAIIAPVLLTQLCCVIITHIYAPYRPRLSIRKIPELWSFSIWMTFSAMFQTLAARLDALLIGGILGQRAVGFYTYGDEKASLPTRELTTPLVRLLFPALAAVRHEPERLAAAYRRVQALIFALAAPLGVGFALVSDMFVHILLGDKWAPIIPIMQTLSVALAFENLILTAAPLAMALGLTRTLFARDALVFFCRVPLVAAGLILFGIEGALIGRLAATLCLVWIYLALAKQITQAGISTQLKGCLRSFLSLAAMALSVLAFRSQFPPDALFSLGWLLVTIFVGGLSYTLVHCALWLVAGRPAGPEDEMLSIAQKFLRRGKPA